MWGNRATLIPLVTMEVVHIGRGQNQETIETRINDSLRLFADNGNAQTLINDYRSNENEILEVINDAVKNLGIEASWFKVDYIEPMGK